MLHQQKVLQIALKTKKAKLHNMVKEVSFFAETRMGTKKRGETYLICIALNNGNHLTLYGNFCC